MWSLDVVIFATWQRLVRLSINESVVLSKRQTSEFLAPMQAYTLTNSSNAWVLSLWTWRFALLYNIHKSFPHGMPSLTLDQGSSFIWKYG
jgi:hypothetical protein